MLFRSPAGNATLRLFGVPLLPYQPTVNSARFSLLMISVYHWSSRQAARNPQVKTKTIVYKNIFFIVKLYVGSYFIQKMTLVNGLIDHCACVFSVLLLYSESGYKSRFGCTDPIPRVEKGTLGKPVLRYSVQASCPLKPARAIHFWWMMALTWFDTGHGASSV